MKAESFGGSEMNGGIQVMTRRTQRIVATCATAVMLLAATGAMAAQFTVGNVIVASTPNTASNQVITVAEYTSAGGAAVQSYAIPNSGAPPFIGYNGTSFIGPQINFGDDSNQILYVSATFTNSTAITPGFGRVNATSGTVVLDQATIDGGTNEVRG